MMKYWCLNFDPTVEDRPSGELPRTHGLREGLWLMQYQYSQDGQINQGGAKQISITTRNWRMLPEVSPGDSCVAYISSIVGNSGPKFYAIGTVSKPKQRARQRSGAIHHDTIERTTREQTHLHDEGLVFYDDSTAFYEDFTDDWELHQPKRGQTEIYRYAQRIDIDEWLNVIPDGVRLVGLGASAKSKQFIGSAIIEIDEDFFERISARLQQSS